ncbi:ATP-binding protein [Streptomyces sp. NPDC026672]|uniref:ATP-binding protein n=1 Tax=unclassified Streptomyces TaxID=2593676 RepID=UPI0033F3CEF7
MTTTAVWLSRAVLYRDRDVMDERIELRSSTRGAQPCSEDAARVGAIRRIAAARLRYCGLDALRDDVMLVVSELVTNAVLHAGTSEVRVSMTVRDGFLVVTVVDGVPGAAATRHTDGNSESGRGLELVEAVARVHGGSWGTSNAGAETWCRLAVPPQIQP